MTSFFMSYSYYYNNVNNQLKTYWMKGYKTYQLFTVVLYSCSLVFLSSKN